MRRRLSMDILWFRKWLNKTMSTKVKAAILGIIAVLLGWGAWTVWTIYQTIKSIQEKVPGVTMGTDGLNLVKEDGQGNKFNIRLGVDGLSISGSKDGQPVEIKIDSNGMKAGHGDKQIQIPLEELKKQLKLMNGVREESEE